MNTNENIKIFEQYVIPNYTRKDVVFVKGSGCRLWDADGKEYLDMFPGWGVSILGHCHPALVAAIREQAGRLLHMPNNFYSEPQGILAQKISETSFGGKCFFCNSGTEAVEAAIKLARLAAPDNRKKVISLENSFHGRTLGALSATGQPKYHKGVGPILEGFSYVPINDFLALEAAVNDQTCAIMMEPVQGEGGVNPVDSEYAANVRKLCDERGLVLIFDEVQTGMGRTGKMFGYQHLGVEPDIMTLAKGLGGGVAIGAIAAKDKTAQALVPGTHASTFGGNALACAAGIAVFEIIEKENLLVKAADNGAYIVSRLSELDPNHSRIKEIRAIGLMVGVEMNAPVSDLVDSCLKKGLILNCTHDTVLRFLPALNTSTGDFDHAIDILSAELKKWNP